MKVLHVSSSDIWTDSEEQVNLLFNSLSDEIDQMLFCPENTAIQHEFMLYGKPHRVMPLDKNFSFNYSRELTRTVKDFQPDILHIHDKRSHDAIMLASHFYGLRAPMVLSVRAQIDDSGSLYGRYKYNYRRIKKLICPTSDLKFSVEKILRKPSKLVVIPHSIDPDFYHYHVPFRLKNTLSRFKEHVFIGSHAAIEDSFDYETFVNTAALICQKNQGVHFVIIAEGKRRLAIETKVRKLGLNAHFSFLGARADVYQLLQGLDIYLYTPREELLASNIVEAQLAKIPVVSTNAGCISELFKDGSNILLSEIGDHSALAEQVLKLIANKDLYHSISNQAFEDLKARQKEVLKPKYLEIYQEILGVN